MQALTFGPTGRQWRHCHHVAQGQAPSLPSPASFTTSSYLALKRERRRGRGKHLEGEGNGRENKPTPKGKEKANLWILIIQRERERKEKPPGLISMFSWCFFVMPLFAFHSKLLSLIWRKCSGRKGEGEGGGCFFLLSYLSVSCSLLPPPPFPVPLSLLYTLLPPPPPSNMPPRWRGAAAHF